MGRLLDRLLAGRGSWREAPGARGCLPRSGRSGSLAASGGCGSLPGVALAGLTGLAGRCRRAACLGCPRRRQLGHRGLLLSRPRGEVDHEEEGDGRHASAGRRSLVIGHGHGAHPGQGAPQPGLGRCERSALRQSSGRRLHRHRPQKVAWGARSGCALLPHYMTHGPSCRFTGGKWPCCPGPPESKTVL